MLRLHIPDQLGGERRSRFHMRALNHLLRLLANFYGPLAGSLHVKGTFWSLLTQSNARNNTFQCSNLSKEKQALKRVLRSPRCQLGRKYPRPQTVFGLRPGPPGQIPSNRICCCAHAFSLSLFSAHPLRPQKNAGGWHRWRVFTWACRQGEWVPTQACSSRDRLGYLPHRSICILQTYKLFRFGSCAMNIGPIICFNHKHVFWLFTLLDLL